MSLWNYLSGTLTVEVTSAQPEQTLNAILCARIPISNVLLTTPLTYRFSIRRSDRKHLEKLIHRLGGSLKILNSKGVHRQLKSLDRRPVLSGLLFLLLSASLFLPSRILFVEVEGNQTLPTKQILSAAEFCGIRFGVSRKQVRSEKVKNALLAQLPQLQWAGVNTSGCTAIISVRERTEEKPGYPKSHVSNLIASRDGYILSQVIHKGTPMVFPGETVTKGQLLVSGYTDCGICFRAGRAEGEILAQTKRIFEAVTPDSVGTVNEILDVKYKISLLIRKKRINLWKDSRISDIGCGRMYEEYYFSLPGGFQLPVAVCLDRYLEYRISEEHIPEKTVLEQLQSFSDRYLLEQTVSGQILKKQHYLMDEGCYRLQSRYICTEMIGREQGVQIGDINEQRN